MAGLKPIWLEFMHFLDLKGTSQSAHLFNYLQRIYNVLEDVYSVSGETEIQEAIDQIGDGAGTIFIESGTHVITTTIDIDGGGSLVIYGHGDNTILQPIDGVSVFNITNAESIIFEKLRFDTSNYTGATQTIVVNEINDNIISFEGISIIGNNVGIGIELQSDNCMIEHCNISLMQDGIYINNSNRHIITQNIIQSNIRYGININTSLYSSINGNTLNLNQTGIYVLNSTNNSISNNICNQNTQNGIYLTGSSYNTLSGNTCENNDSNTANDQAGMFITSNSDFNTITGNSLNNNNNIGAGDGYGLLIATATCEENVVASNNWNGNNIDVMDIGVGTTVEYYVQNVDELQDAINSIGSGAGIININSSFNVNATIVIDKNGSYLIEGEGDNTVLTTVGDIKCFNIDIARQVVLKNFKVDASSLTTVAKEIIDVNENNNNLIVFDNVSITGDGTHGYGIELNSNNCRINNCNIDNVSIGINILSTDNMLQGNKIYSCNNYGIQVKGNKNSLYDNESDNNSVGIYLDTADYNQINGNYIEGNTLNGIYLSGSNYNALNDNYCIGNDSNTGNPQGGIVIDSDSDNNTIISNTSINNNNAGAGKGYGILINNADCLENIIKDNNCSGNDIQYWDLGVNTDIIYRCSTEKDIQDAIDSIAAKSGIVHILPVAGGIQLSATILVNGGGDYIIEGEGEGSVIDCAGDRVAFSITSAKSGTTLRNFKIDSADITTNLRHIISIAEGSNNKIILDNLTVIGDADQKGYCVYGASNNIVIRNCNFSLARYGIRLESVSDCLIINNIFVNNDQTSIYLNGCSGILVSGNNCTGSVNGVLLNITFDSFVSTNICNGIIGNSIYVVSSDRNTIVGNTCNNSLSASAIAISSSDYNICIGNTCHGCYEPFMLYDANYNIIGSNMLGNVTIILGIDSYLIELRADCSGNTIHNNILHDATNTGAGDFHGIFITNATDVSNIIEHNTYFNLDINYIDNGNGTILHADDTVYGVSWLGDLGTPTKNVVYNKIESLEECYWEAKDVTYNCTEDNTNRTIDCSTDITHDYDKVVSVYFLLKHWGTAFDDYMQFWADSGFKYIIEPIVINKNHYLTAVLPCTSDKKFDYNCDVGSTSQIKLIGYIYKA